MTKFGTYSAPFTGVPLTWSNPKIFQKKKSEKKKGDKNQGLLHSIGNVVLGQ